MDELTRLRNRVSVLERALRSAGVPVPGEISDLDFMRPYLAIEQAPDMRTREIEALQKAVDAKHARTLGGTIEKAAARRRKIRDRFLPPRDEKQLAAYIDWARECRRQPALAETVLAYNGGARGRVWDVPAEVIPMLPKLCRRFVRSARLESTGGDPT